MNADKSSFLSASIGLDRRRKIFFLLMVIFVFGSGAFPAFAQEQTSPPVTNVKEIKKKIQKNKKDLAAIKQKLLAEEKKQRQARVKERNVLNRLQKLDQALGRKRREKEANQQDLEETRIRIDRLQNEMKGTKDQLAQSRFLLKQRLQALYRMSFREPFLGGLLDSGSFGEFARKLKFEMILARSNEKLLNQTLAHEQHLEQDASLWTAEERRKNRIVSVISKQEKNYSKERQNRTVFLNTIRKKQASREQAIQELSDQAQELQSKVALFLRQAAESKKNSIYVSRGTGLKVRRGRIPWPVSGEIISPFGKFKNREFNAVVDNSGIQIKAPPGTPIRAVAGGLVRFADWFKGYGKLVILDHGQGYYSLYAQASELNVSEGQEVLSGQVIGSVGDTGSLVGSSLYFEIRKNGVPQDPQRWLARR